MTQKVQYWVLSVAVVLVLLTSGCVERKLTIVTEPSEAIVWLNDEEVGTTPVTVNFNWYGDYNIRIEKDGYNILDTHRQLERPMHDKFPFDFFAEVVTPRKIVDEYIWTFELQAYQPASSEELVIAAEELRQRANNDLGKIAAEILREE